MTGRYVSSTGEYGAEITARKQDIQLEATVGSVFASAAQRLAMTGHNGAFISGGSGQAELTGAFTEVSGDREVSLKGDLNVKIAATTNDLVMQAGHDIELASFTATRVVGGYGVAFYLLSLVLRTLPVGITYAIWAGLGIVLVTLVGIMVFGEKPDLPAVLGISLIVAGVVTLQVFSKMNVH